MLKIAIDANEANVEQRVGSNVYAYQLLLALYQLTAKRKNLDFSILLSGPKVADLPPSRPNWRYLLISPSRLWTQWALPLHLFLHRRDYQLFFTPGHYAPRLSAVPYISSVMDLAFLHYQDHFRPSDLLQLTAWTKYSVKHAKKVLTISQFSKQEVIKHYQRRSSDVFVVYPAAQLTTVDSVVTKDFFKQHKIQHPYFLYLGTLQPRKNLDTLIAAFEQFQRQRAALNQELRKKRRRELPEVDLVIAGKLGWLTEAILARIKQSPFKQQVILPGFVSDAEKKALYQNALASFLLSPYEGFGIPALESLQAGCLPVVSNVSSLPEVVGRAGIQIDPYDSGAAASKMLEILRFTPKDRQRYAKHFKNQVNKFSWQKSAALLLKQLEKSAKNP